MSKLNYLHTFNALSLAMLLGASGVTFAKEDMKKDKVVNIDAYTCERLISVSSEDRSTAIAFLHGYRTGMSGKKTINTEKLGIASDKLVVHCLDHPTDKAVVALDKVSK